MLEVLKELPEELEGLYNGTIRQILDLSRRSREFCRLVLSTVTLAYRPLQISELAIISGLPTEISDRIEMVVTRCKPFLAIKENVV